MMKLLNIAARIELFQKITINLFPGQPYSFL